MSTTRRRGFTVAEVIVASFVGLLLMSASYQLVASGLRLWTTSNKRSHLRQHANVAINRMAHDLRLTCIDSVVIDASSVHDADLGTEESCLRISFISPLDADGQIQVREDGTIIWQKYETLYLDPTRHEVRVAFRPLQMIRNEVVLRCETFAPNASEDRVVARNVRGLSADAPLEPAADLYFSRPLLFPVRRNPVLIEIHAYDTEEDCRLQTGVSCMLPGLNLGGVIGL